MTQDEIIRMAREAGCHQEEDGCGTYMVLPESSWETFADLVAEATKTEYGVLAAQAYDKGTSDCMAVMKAEVEAAIEATKEKAAKLVENASSYQSWQVAAAIRGME